MGRRNHSSTVARCPRRRAVDRRVVQACSSVRQYRCADPRPRLAALRKSSVTCHARSHVSSYVWYYFVATSLRKIIWSFLLLNKATVWFLVTSTDLNLLMLTF